MDIIEIFESKITDWGQNIIKMLPNIVTALAVLILFVMIARLTKTATAYGLKKTKIRSQLRGLIVAVSGIAVVLLGAFVALTVLDLDKTVTSLLAGAGIIGIAIGFAFQDMLSNLVAGIVLAIKSPFKIGDNIETNGYFGKVQDVNLRYTRITSFDGKSIYLPNKDIFENPLVNFTQQGIRRVEVEVGVSYDSDLEQVEEIVVDSLKELHDVEDKKIDILFDEFGDSSINLIARFWIDERKEHNVLSAKSQAIKAIFRALNQNNIDIPFPVRTLDFKVAEAKNVLGGK